MSRNHQILDMLAEGKTDQQIGDAIGLKPGSVNKILADMRKPLGLDSRYELAMWWKKRRAA